MPYLAILLLLLGGCARATLWDLDLDAEYDRAVTWIAAHEEGERMLMKRPVVFTTSQKEMQRISKAGPGRRIAAVYSRWVHALAFATDFDPSNVKDRGIAIHEVVHALNRRRPNLGACARSREVEPYRLQGLYYEERGTTMLREMGLTPVAVKELTTC